MGDPSNHVQSVATTFRVIEALDRRGRAGVTEVARETGITKSSAYKHLDTLDHLGYVTQTDAGYALSYRWFRVGRSVRQRETLYRLARPYLSRLARRTGETASLVVAEDGDAVYLAQVCEAEEPAGPVPEGGRIPAFASVGGKAIYAYRPDEAARALLADSDDAAVDGLLAELSAVREQRLVVELSEPVGDGFSAGALEGHRHVADHDEPYRDVHGAAVPVRTPEGRGVAAIEVAGPATALSARRLEADVATRLVEAGKAVETDLLRQD